MAGASITPLGPGVEADWIALEGSSRSPHPFTGMLSSKAWVGKGGLPVQEGHSLCTMVGRLFPRLQIHVQEDWREQDGNSEEGTVGGSEVTYPLTAKEHAQGFREGREDGAGSQRQNLCSRAPGEANAAFALLPWLHGKFSWLLSDYSYVKLNICLLGNIWIIENRICLNSRPWNKALPGTSPHHPLSPCAWALGHKTLQGPQQSTGCPGSGFPKVAKDDTFGLLGSKVKMLIFFYPDEMFIFYPHVLATKTKLKTAIRNFSPPPILHAYTDLELFLIKPDLMAFKQQKLHSKPVTLLGAHYQLATGNAESGFCIYIHSNNR